VLERKEGESYSRFQARRLRAGEIDTLEPYDHDCKACKWVGWFTPPEGGAPLNVYLCGETVIIRFSSEDSDYWSQTVGNTDPHPIGR